MNKRLYLAYSTYFLYVCVCVIACVSCLCPSVIFAQALTTVSLHYPLKPLLWATAKGLQVVLHKHILKIIWVPLIHNPLLLIIFASFIYITDCRGSTGFLSLFLRQNISRSLNFSLSKVPRYNIVLENWFPGSKLAHFSKTILWK